MATPSATTYLIPGLEWSKSKYTAQKSRKAQFDANVARAEAVIEKKLPALAGLKSIVRITFGDNHGNLSSPPITIDARSGKEAKLAKHADVEALPKEDVVTLTIEPEYLLKLAEGKGSGDFQGINAGPGDTISISTIFTSMRLADLLHPNPPSLVTPASAYPPDSLPKPTTDIAQLKQDLVKWGYAFAKDALSPAQVEIIKQAVLEQAAGERQAAAEGTMALSFEGPNQRINALINKGDEFLDLLNDPLIDEIVPWYIGDHALLASYSVNIANPGGFPQHLHRDQGIHGPPNHELPYGVQIAYYLVDTTDENGATRVIPGSHVGNVAPRDRLDGSETVAAAAPAGTAMIFDSRLWHGTGANRTTDQVRPVILTYFMRFYLRTIENYYLPLRKDVEAKLSDRHRSLLGFRVAGTAIGGVEGITPGDPYIQRKEGRGRMRVPVESA